MHSTAKSRTNKTDSSCVNTYNQPQAIIHHIHFTSVRVHRKSIVNSEFAIFSPLYLYVSNILTMSSTFLTLNQTNSTRYTRQHTRQTRTHLTCNYILFSRRDRQFRSPAVQINNISEHHLHFVICFTHQFICSQLDNI